jgi:retron-type reverse transcriptase
MQHLVEGLTAFGKTHNRGILPLVGRLKPKAAISVLRRFIVRRHGNLWPEITSKENLEIAYHKATLGKRTMANVVKFSLDVEGNLSTIQKLLVSKEFRTSSYHEKIVYEPKQRTIYVLPFNPDRIVQHALMNVIAPIWEKLFIHDSYACIPGRGIHLGSRRTMEFVRRNKYVLKCDISKFYPSIEQEILMSVIEKKIKCRDTLWLVDEIVHSFPGGKNIPIGNYTSQWFGNLILNELDVSVKVNLQTTFGHIDYIRYCDDFCLFHNDKKILYKCREEIQEFLAEKLALRFSKAEVFPVSQGVDFLGYRHFNNYILLRKSTAKRVCKRLERLPKLYERGEITAEQYRSSVGSTWGWLKHANTHNLAAAMKFREMMEEVRKIA